MTHTPEEIKGLEEQLQLITRKLNYLQEGKILETDPSRLFKIEEDIKRAEDEKASIQAELSQVFNIHESSGKGLLHELASQISIDEDKGIGLAHLVNCDREEPKTFFWDSFDEQLDKEQKFQYYFVLADPVEMPHSFAERMIYEIIVEELQQLEEAIHYVRHTDSQRVKIEDLPLMRNLKRSKDAFKEYVQNRFEFASTDSFEAFIQTGVPKLPYKFVTVVFELHERSWKPFISQYLEWMMDTFKSPHQEVPHFIFFFVFYLDNLTDFDRCTDKQKEIIQNLTPLYKAEKAVLLNPLQAVDVADLRAWFMDIGERNPNVYEAIIANLIKGLGPNERQFFEKHNRLHMKDVEEVQKVVYKVANE